MRISLLLAVLALALGACDGTTDDDFTPQLVVAAQLGAGEPLPSVRLTRTSPFLDVYDPTDLGVVGATVTVTRTGADEAVYVYVPTQTPGVYAPADASVTVTAGTTYRLRVEADAREETIGLKIRESQLQKLPYMLVVGDREVANGGVGVRSGSAGDQGASSVDTFLAAALDEIARKSRPSSAKKE